VPIRFLTALKNLVVSADPASPTEGDIWWRSDLQSMKVQGSAGATQILGQSYDRLVFSIQGTLQVASGVSRLYLARNATFSACYISANTAPTGAAIIADVKLGGTSIFTGVTANRPTIAASSFAGTAGAPATTSFTSGNYLTVDILQVGSTVAGADFTMTLLVTN
jgi:hypothetical protein